MTYTAETIAALADAHASRDREIDAHRASCALVLWPDEACDCDAA